MKAKPLLALVLGTFLLSACNLTLSNRSSGENKPVSTTATTTSENVKETTLNRLVENLSNPNHQMTTTVGTTAYGTIYFTDRGYMETYDGESAGVVYNGQAWFHASVSKGSVTLGGIVSLNKDARPYASGVDIALLGKDIYNADAQDPKKFTSNDERLLEIGAELFGYEDSSFDRASLIVGEDSITYTFYLGKSSVEYCFTSFGTSKYKVLDDFIANPTTVRAPSSFDSSSRESLERIMGEDTNKLPFPNFASFAFEVDYDIPRRSLRMLEMMPSRSNLSTYGTQLVNAGFVADNRNATSNDVKLFTLAKTNDSSRYYEVEMSYYSAEELDDAGLPYGALLITVSRRKSVPENTTVNAEYIASRWNANVEAAGKTDRKVEYDATTKRYSLVGLFGEYDEATEILVTAMADSLLQCMPEEVIAVAAGFADPSDGYEDIIGNGSAYYLFEGETKNNAVSVSLITCVYSGHLAVLFYISNN